MPEAIGVVKLFWKGNADFANRVQFIEDVKEFL